MKVRRFSKKSAQNFNKTSRNFIYPSQNFNKTSRNFIYPSRNFKYDVAEFSRGLTFLFWFKIFAQNSAISVSWEEF